MTKILFLIVSMVFFSESSIGLQTVLKVGNETMLYQRLHSSSKYLHIPKRIFSSNLPDDQITFLGESKKMQVFSRPTYDRIAKYILSEDESVRVDILKAFTGIESLSSAKQVDEHYNPFDAFNRLRELINSYESKTLFEKINNSSTISVSLNGRKSKSTTEFLKDLANLHKDISSAFPDQRHRSTVDFICKTAFGYITIEFQVAKQDHWDKRALSYIASIFGNQLRTEDNYGDIKDVIGINLLGDGSTPYWKDGRFKRDYTFIDQMGSENKIPSLRLIQYSLGDVNLNHKDLKENEHLKQWIEFFKSAHEKHTIPQSIDENVKKAYDMIRVDNLKKTHPELLIASDEFFASLTEHDQAVKEKGLEEGMAKANQELAKKLNRKGMDSKEIAELTGLNEEEVLKLKNHDSTKE